MCGINGILSFDGTPVEEFEITRMRDTLAHRGPDGVGVWISSDRRVGLGHRRLSIIDLSPLAAQPMTNEDGSLQIIFNGEIYNHAEIRRELEARGGHTWRTDHSDTEVILHAYETWGIDCIHRFRGMFAIALWDARRQRLWLIRDRIGIKPLYYTTVGGRLVFASEIKAILTLPEVPRRVDHEAMFHYLSFLTAPAPQTLFAGIHKLPAATRMCVSLDGTVRQERYWDPWDNVNPLTGVSEDEIATRLLDELRTAVRYRKVSDVPVGVFLSGGIDSSANAALFSEDDSVVRTFSIGYDSTRYGSYPSELPYARKVAALVGAEHHDMELDVDHVLSFLQPMVYHQDEPIGDVVCVPLYYVAKLARDNGVIVCQVGEGSDELFCGYPTWLKHLRMARLNDLPVPSGLKALGLSLLGAAGGRDSFAYEYLRRTVAGEPLFRGGAEGLTEREKQRVLSADLRREFAGASSADAIEEIRQRFLARSWEPTHFHWMTYLDLNLRLPELLLMRVDKMTMATSIEGRVPFLDHKFVELALSIPTEVKTRNGQLKPILKRAVRGLIPDDIIDRPKQGFGVPMREWIGGRLGDEIRRRIDRFADATGIFDRKALAEFYEEAGQSKVWQLFNVAQWHAEFIERAPASRDVDSHVVALA
jgi:asparagine synthase (glutamine-hydrolysing)